MYLQKSSIANILLILFISIQGVLLLGKWQIIRHKQTIHHTKVKKNIWLTFSYDQWQSVEKMNASEIRIEGKMFDIKSLRFNKNQVLVFGHFDSKEDRLLAKERDLQKKNKSQNSLTQDLQLFYEEPITTSFDSPTFGSLNHTARFLARYSFCYYKVEMPPPQFYL